MTDHPPSRAFSNGESVFTTMRVENGRAFFLDAHKERLQQSVAWLWPTLTASFTSGWDETLNAIPERNGVWRVGLSASETLYFHTLWQEGISENAPHHLETAESPKRDENRPAFLKLPDYEARQKKSLSGLYVFEGRVCEMLYHNVIFLKGKAFHTPSAGPQVLSGVGRAHLKHWALASGWQWEERDILVSELLGFDAALAINAVRGVSRIASIDGHEYPAHPVEEKLRQEFFVHAL